MNEFVDVLKKIESNGFKAYAVGGFVRDYYRNVENPDVDICTSAKPDELKIIFGSDISLDQYGSMILNYNDKRYEITTFRRESKYMDNRHPSKIKYVKRLKTDLKRRDFTMNALCLTSDLNFIDYFDGMKDINNKTIKMIGKPEKRLKEDSLRILRAVRFATTLDFNLDENLINAIKMNGHLLHNISYFYKKRELEKIFLSPNINRGLNLIKDLKLDDPLELKNIDKLVITNSLIGIWAQLGVVDTYPFTKEERILINSVNKLAERDLLDPHILYNNELVVLKLSAEIRNININSVVDAYNNLPIHQFSDVNISYQEITDILKDQDLVNNCVKDIIHLILSNKISNEHDILYNYVESKR